MATSYASRLGTAPEEGIKAPCVVAASSNITLSGEQTINSIAVVAGDRVLVIGQTDTTENGIYDVGVGAWTRAKDWNDAQDVVTGQLVTVPNAVYKAVFTGSYSPGVTALSFSSILSVLPNNTDVYEFTTDIALNSHNSIVTGHTIMTQHYDSNRVVGSGDEWMFTGTTTPARAGDGVYTDGFVYDVDGKQFRSKQIRTKAQMTALTGVSHGKVVTIPDLGVYEYDATSTATANGGTIVATDAGGTGRWLYRNGGQPIAVEVFGTTQAQIQAAIDAVSVLICNGTYTVDELNVTSATIIDGQGKGTFTPSTTSGAINMFDVTVSNVILAGLKVVGTDTDNTYANGYVADRHGIYIHGANSSSDITDVKVSNCLVQNWGDTGVKMEFVNDSEMFNTKIERCGYFGFLGLSNERVKVYDSHAEDIFPGVGGSAPYLNAYGFSFTRSGSEPVPNDCEFNNCTAKDVVTWEGFDTHYGTNVRFINCSTVNCNQGVAVQSVTVGAESDDIQVKGGTHKGYGQGYSYRGQTFDTGSGVIINAGSTVTPGRCVSVEGVIISDMGSGQNSSNAAITLSEVDSWSISNCIIQNAFKRGISINEVGSQGSVNGNVIDGVTSVGSIAYGMEFSSESSGTVTGNTVEGAADLSFRSVSGHAMKFGVNDCDDIEAITDGATVSVEPHYRVTTITTTGAATPTLADGVEGQQRMFVMVVDAGDATLTPTNLGNGTTVTFNDVGDTALLYFTGGNWYFMGGTATLA